MWGSAEEVKEWSWANNAGICHWRRLPLSLSERGSVTIPGPSREFCPGDHPSTFQQMQGKQLRLILKNGWGEDSHNQTQGSKQTGRRGICFVFPFNASGYESLDSLERMVYEQRKNGAQKLAATTSQGSEAMAEHSFSQIGSSLGQRPRTNMRTIW